MLVSKRACAIYTLCSYFVKLLLSDFGPTLPRLTDRVRGRGCLQCLLLLSEILLGAAIGLPNNLLRSLPVEDLTGSQVVEVQGAAEEEGGGDGRGWSVVGL